MLPFPPGRDPDQSGKGVGFLIGVLCLLIVTGTMFFSTGDCFIRSDPDTKFLEVFLSILALLAACLLAYWIRSVASPSESRPELPADASFYLFVCAIFVSLALSVVFMLGYLSLVLATSSVPARFNATVTVDKQRSGREPRCHVYISFYNPPIQREVRVCAENRGLRTVSSGESLAISEEVGPFGAHFLGAAHR
jgi:hypothetical protein